MKKEIKIMVEESVLMRFEMALQLNNDNFDAVCERYMKNYYIESFSKEIRNDNADSAISTNESSYFGKALKKISIWANRSSQINFKILRAYLQLCDELEYVTYDNLSARCSDDINHPDVFVPTFASNFTQMRFDSEKSHGKVFVVDDNGIISLWEYVEDEIMKYKETFLKLQSTDIGYINRNNQMTIGRTDISGTDHLQKLYIIKCLNCGNEDYVNGTTIYEAKCKKCSREGWSAVYKP